MDYKAGTCKSCGRSVWSHHLSEDGNCILCQPVGTSASGNPPAPDSGRREVTDDQFKTANTGVSSTTGKDVPQEGETD